MCGPFGLAGKMAKGMGPSLLGGMAGAALAGKLDKKPQDKAPQQKRPLV